jgi:hypothetical protein
MASGTLCRATKGWLAACGTATAAIYVLVLLFVASGPNPRAFMLGWVDLAASLIFLPVILVVTCVLTVVPAALVIWLSERFQMRSALFFGCAGGATGALGQIILFQGFVSIVAALFILVGFLAGLIYWRIARKAAN